MRKQNLFGLSIFLSMVIIYLVRAVLPYFGIELSFLQNLSSPLVASFIFAPILLLLLTPLNNRLLEYRKKHGRDIEEEEKYETETGFIKLTPNDEDKK